MVSSGPPHRRAVLFGRNKRAGRSVYRPYVADPVFDPAADHRRDAVHRAGGVRRVFVFPDRPQPQPERHLPDRRRRRDLSRRLAGRDGAAGHQADRRSDRRHRQPRSDVGDGAKTASRRVVVQFKLDTNLDYAAIDVQRRVDTARVYMPTDLDPPLVDKSAGSQQAPILTLALSSKHALGRPRSPISSRSASCRISGTSQRAERRRPAATSSASSTCCPIRCA